MMIVTGNQSQIAWSVYNGVMHGIIEGLVVNPNGNVAVVKLAVGTSPLDAGVILSQFGANAAGSTTLTELDPRAKRIEELETLLAWQECEDCDRNEERATGNPRLPMA